MCIKWGQTTSEYFTVSNGVTRSGVLLHHLFAVYVDDLSKQVIFIGDSYIHQVSNLLNQTRLLWPVADCLRRLQQT